MARRKSSTFEDLVHLAAKIPWWASVILAGITFGGLHYLSGKTPDPHAVKSLNDLAPLIQASYVQTLANFLQYIIPSALLLGAVLGFIGKPAANDANTPPVAAKNNDSACPDCGAPMLKRKARRGANAGGEFLGCSTFPKCRGTRVI
jgi:hypothetical protein